jgi:hypothetical protein
MSNVEILKRITSLEEMVKKLSLENTILTDLIKSHILSKSSSGSSDEVPADGKKRKAIKREKRDPTNPSGPTAWNDFVSTTWRSMVEDKGREIPEDKAAFIKVAKEAGISYQDALQEAKVRKADMEGREVTEKVKKVKEPKAEKTEKKAEKKESKTEKKESKPKAKKEKTEAEINAELKAAFEEMGMEEVIIDGTTYYMDKDTNNVFEKTGEYEFGDLVGIYDPETGEFESDSDSDSE